MGFIWTYFSAIASRLIFIGHGMWSLKEIIERMHVGNEEEASNSVIWTLSIIMAFIVLEGTYTLIIRKGHEYKFFWPTGFFYLALMIPAACLLETFLLEEELKCVAAEEKNSKTNSSDSQLLVKVCQVVAHANKGDQKLRSAVEIGMLGALVIGRWLLPRGDLTRDQLSSLLLAFISNGADVIEFLNTWNDFPALRNRKVTYTVLVLYSWSLLQFAVVATRTTDEYEHEEEEGGNQRTNTTTPIFETVFENTEANKIEPVRRVPVARRKISASPNIPRYVQKLMKKNPKRKISKSAMHTLRTRTSTLDGLKAKLSLAAATRDVTPLSDVNANPATVMGNKKTKIRFNDEPSYKSSAHASAATAQYLQNLAAFEQWTKFNSELKKAHAVEFTSNQNNNMEDFSFSGDDDDVFEEQKKGLIYRIASKFDQDVFQIFILLFTLELPYFTARVAFTCIYNVSNLTMVFYMTKNMIMMIFLVYRLWVIFSGKTEDDELAGKDLVTRDALTVK